MAQKPSNDDREARRKAALRANLKRRKVAARGAAPEKTAKNSDSSAQN